MFNVYMSYSPNGVLCSHLRPSYTMETKETHRFGIVVIFIQMEYLESPFYRKLFIFSFNLTDSTKTTRKMMKKKYKQFDCLVTPLESYKMIYDHHIPLKIRNKNILQERIAQRQRHTFVASKYNSNLSMI